MNFSKPSLDMALPCRRELLWSMLSSILLTGVIAGCLALVTYKVAQSLEISESAQPLTVSHTESEVEEEQVEDEVMFEPSPAVAPAPAAAAPSIQVAAPVSESVPVPEVEVPAMDSLSWSEESFEPWEEVKKPEVKKKPVKRTVVAKKSTPRPKTPAARPTPKPTTVKPVQARVVKRSTPSYPSKARRSGVEGRVVVTVTISTSGSVSSARISQSSRDSSLDSAALRAAKKYRFSPAKNSRGQVVTTQVSLPFSFKLT